MSVSLFMKIVGLAAYRAVCCSLASLSLAKQLLFAKFKGVPPIIRRLTPLELAARMFYAKERSLSKAASSIEMLFAAVSTMTGAVWPENRRSLLG